MSSKDGSVLVWYHGWASRRARASSGWWPCRAYQTTTRDWISIPNGTVRSTAFLTRLRACPTPICCLPTALAGSIDQRIAYRSTICAGVAVWSGVCRGQVVGLGRAELAGQHAAAGGAAGAAVPGARHRGQLHGLGAP